MDFQSKKEFRTFDDPIAIIYHSLELKFEYNHQIKAHGHVEQILKVLELPIKKIIHIILKPLYSNLMISYFSVMIVSVIM